ncbi:hypothetical protein DSO57_1001210 [Entomophthora muscae]|uniref:Uncharacterized protein n=1 Tax=Entomophthora muscae TaxID=34485 RepID=A0ACC2TWK9_9FUNG|nr:hypothetical protein DSO57_1001210 [Entomophthora muscae]
MLLIFIFAIVHCALGAETSSQGLVITNPFSTATRQKRENSCKCKPKGVEWELNCSDKAGRCDKVKHALELMAQSMENALVLKRIRIQLNFKSLSSSLNIFNKQLSKRQQYNLINVTDSQGSFLYPQALFKQEKRKETPTLNPFDIVIEIDAEFSFYFPMDYSEKQKTCEFDFMAILTHEVLHGLGFQSSLHKSNEGLYIPHKVTSTYKSGKIKTEFLFTVFDKHIVFESNMTPFSHYANQLRSLGPINSSTKDKRIGNPHLKVFKTLTALIRNNYYFNTSSHQQLKLKGYSILSDLDLSHLDSSFYKQQDEAIIPDFWPKEGLYNLFNSQNKWLTSPFGPNSLAILATLGYKINPTPNYEHSLEHFYAKLHPLPANPTETSLFRFNPSIALCASLFF